MNSPTAPIIKKEPVLYLLFYGILLKTCVIEERMIVMSVYRWWYPRWCHVDLDTRGLECRPLQWNGEDEPLGCPLFCGPDDLWKLRPLQSASGHSRRRILCRGIFYFFNPGGTWFFSWTSFHDVHVVLQFIPNNNQMAWNSLNWFRDTQYDMCLISTFYLIN